MNATRAYVLLIVLTGFAAAGCDNKPAVPPVSETASPETAPKTQPVDLSKRHPLELLYLPVSVRVPDGWEVKPEGHTVFLEGPVPAPSTLPNVSIQLSRRATMSDADYASFLRGTQARMARGPLQIDGPRRAGQLTILEERSVPPAPQDPPRRPARCGVAVVSLDRLGVRRIQGAHPRTLRPEFPRPGRGDLPSQQRLPAVDRRQHRLRSGGGRGSVGRHPPLSARTGRKQADANHPPGAFTHGRLHLGNARTFLVNWLLARRGGWRVLLRMEDLDGPRMKPAPTARPWTTSAGSGSTGTKGRSTNRPVCRLPAGDGQSGRRGLRLPVRVQPAGGGIGRERAARRMTARRFTPARAGGVSRPSPAARAATGRSRPFGSECRAKSTS